jgi:hypothetical protein
MQGKKGEANALNTLANHFSRGGAAAAHPHGDHWL